MDEQITLTIQNKEYTIDRPRLKKWVRLESLTKKIGMDFSKKNYVAGAMGILEYVQIFINEADFNIVTWDETIFCYEQIKQLSFPQIDFPILKDTSKQGESSWDYPERTWFYWSNLFAKVYGWQLEIIADLEIEEAIGLLQEIISDRQDDKEWSWSLSEIAYPYNESSKKSTFKPLPRPSWLMGEKEKPKIVRVAKDMMPMGNIVVLSDIIKER
jgi:hypothetical protein